MATKHEKVYLGDGVYARMDGVGNLVLTTEDGIRETNTIYLEPEVYEAFMRFILRLCPACREPNCHCKDCGVQCHEKHLPEGRESENTP